MAKTKTRSRTKAAAKAKLERKSPRKAATAARRRAAQSRNRARGKSARAKARAAAPALLETAPPLVPVAMPAPVAVPALTARRFRAEPVAAAAALPAVYEPKPPRTITLRLAVTLPSPARLYSHLRVRRALFPWRQAQRSFDPHLQRALREFDTLRRAMRHSTAISLIRAQGRLVNFTHRLQRSSGRLARLARSEAALRSAALQRQISRNLVRYVRHASIWLRRRAETKIYEAGNHFRRNFGPAIEQMPAAHCAAVAGAVTALAVALISIGWLAVFDQATAVPNRKATAVATANVWDNDAHPQNPVLANIELPQPQYPVAPPTFAMPPAAAVPAVSAPAAKAMAKSVPNDQVPMDTVTPLPIPAPLKKVAPDRHERAVHERRHNPRHYRRTSSRVVRERQAEAGTAYASVDPSAGFGNSLVDEARRYLGTNPTGRASLWCGAFMDLILRKTGHKGGGNLALGYEHYGTRVSGPEIGAIAVMSRRGGGHVGVVAGIDPNGNPILISGNHNHTVAEAVYPRRRVITYVMPN